MEAEYCLSRKVKVDSVQHCTSSSKEFFEAIQIKSFDQYAHEKT